MLRYRRKSRDSTSVVSVHHPELEPELELEVGTELSEEKYKTLSEEDYKSYHRQFKGFDVELVYQITQDERDVDEPLEVGTILPSKEYRALEKANQKVTYTVTEVFHPHFTHAVGDELSEDVYD